MFLFKWAEPEETAGLEHLKKMNSKFKRKINNFKRRLLKSGVHHSHPGSIGRI